MAVGRHVARPVAVRLAVEGLPARRCRYCQIVPGSSSTGYKVFAAEHVAAIVRPRIAHDLICLPAARRGSHRRVRSSSTTRTNSETHRNPPLPSCKRWVSHVEAERTRAAPTRRDHGRRAGAANFRRTSGTPGRPRHLTAAAGCVSAADARRPACRGRHAVDRLRRQGDRRPWRRRDPRLCC